MVVVSLALTVEPAATEAEVLTRLIELNELVSGPGVTKKVEVEVLDGTEELVEIVELVVVEEEEEKEEELVVVEEDEVEIEELELELEVMLLEVVDGVELEVDKVDEMVVELGSGVEIACSVVVEDVVLAEETLELEGVRIEGSSPPVGLDPSSEVGPVR